jgi:hypothetical protein
MDNCGQTSPFKQEGLRNRNECDDAGRQASGSVLVSGDGSGCPQSARFPEACWAAAKDRRGGADRVGCWPHRASRVDGLAVESPALLPRCDQEPSPLGGGGVRVEIGVSNDSERDGHDRP